MPGLSNYYYLNYSADAGVKEPRPDAEAFFQKYEKQFNERPGSGQGITGYSVIEAWARAADKARQHRDRIRSALSSRNSPMSRFWPD